MLTNNKVIAIWVSNVHSGLTGQNLGLIQETSRNIFNKNPGVSKRSMNRRPKNLWPILQNASRYPIISKSCSIKGPSWQNPIRPRLALAIAACLHINLCHSLLWTCPNLIFLRLPQVGVGVEPISEDRSQPLPKSISWIRILKEVHPQHLDSSKVAYTTYTQEYD